MADLHESDLAGVKKGDWRKGAIGRLVRRSTTLSAGWIAEAQKTGDP